LFANYRTKKTDKIFFRTVWSPWENIHFLKENKELITSSIIFFLFCLCRKKHNSNFYTNYRTFLLLFIWCFEVIDLPELSTTNYWIILRQRKNPLSCKKKSTNWKKQFVFGGIEKIFVSLFEFFYFWVHLCLYRLQIL
jgi:hypothetical protein